MAWLLFRHRKQRFIRCRKHLPAQVDRKKNNAYCKNYFLNKNVRGIATRLAQACSL